MEKNLIFAYIIVIAGAPLVTLLLYVLFFMIRKKFQFRACSVKKFGRIIDSYPESVAWGGRTWHPVIRYFTPQHRKVIFIPDSTLMFRPRRGKRISINVLKENPLVANRLGLDMGVITAFIVSACGSYGFAYAFFYSVFSEKEIFTCAHSFIIAYAGIFSGILCCAFIPECCDVFLRIFSVKRARITELTPNRNRAKITTSYRAKAKLLHAEKEICINAGSCSAIEYGNMIWVHYNKNTGKYERCGEHMTAYLFGISCIFMMLAGISAKYGLF